MPTATRPPALWALAVRGGCWALLLPAMAEVLIPLDPDLPFRIEGKTWELGAEQGHVAPTGTGEARRRVQVTGPAGWLEGEEARFSPTDGWVDLAPVEGNWRHLTIVAARAHLQGKVLDLENAWISSCQSVEHPDYTLRAARLQVVDFHGYTFIHATDAELSIAGITLARVPRLDLNLDTLMEQRRSPGVYAGQGWFAPGMNLDAYYGLSLSTQFRFLHRPGAKGYLNLFYSTTRQASLTGVTELTDGSDNLLLAVLGYQSPGPEARIGPWGYLYALHRLGNDDRVSVTISGRELLSGQTVSRTPELALVSDWRSLGPLEYRYRAKGGEFLIEDARPVTRLSAVTELALPVWHPWEGAQIQPMVEGVSRGYLHATPLLGAGVQLQGSQALGDWFLMARWRQRWATGPNPLFFENYVSDQIVGGMVAWQVMPILRVGVFGEWSVLRQYPVAMDMMASLVTDCLALHGYYSPLYQSGALRANLLAF